MRCHASRAASRPDFHRTATFWDPQRMDVQRSSFSVGACVQRTPDVESGLLTVFSAHCSSFEPRDCEGLVVPVRHLGRARVENLGPHHGR